MKINNLHFLYWAWLILIALCYSCKKETVIETIDIPKRYEYYPLQIGKWIEYRVDSIYFDDFTGTVVKDTIRMTVREVHESWYNTPGATDSSIRIQVLVKYDSALTFVQKYTWYVQRVGDRLEKTDENFRFVKLDFPPLENKSWNGNIYLDQNPNDPNDPLFDWYQFYENWNYTYQIVDQPTIVGSLSFPKSVYVLQTDNENLVEKKYAQERYAEHVGMIYKEVWKLETQDFSCPACPWEDRAEKGFITKWQIIDYN